MLDIRMALAPGALADSTAIPANAGTQASYSARTPASAGVTSRGAY